MSLRTFLTLLALLWLALSAPRLIALRQAEPNDNVATESAPATPSVVSQPPTETPADMPKPTLMQRLGQFVKDVVNALPSELAGILTCVVVVLTLLGLWLLSNLGRILALLQAHETLMTWKLR